MVRIFQTTEIGAPGDDVWRVAGRPEAIADFHPEVVVSSVTGDIRTSTLADGSLLLERIVERSSVHRYYTYELVGSAAPIRFLRGCLAVRGHGDHSHVDWDVELVAEPDADGRALASAVDRDCGAALESLRTRLERTAAAA